MTRTELLRYSYQMYDTLVVQEPGDRPYPICLKSAVTFKSRITYHSLISFRVFIYAQHQQPHQPERAAHQVYTSFQYQHGAHIHRQYPLLDLIAQEHIDAISVRRQHRLLRWGILAFITVIGGYRIEDMRKHIEFRSMMRAMVILGCSQRQLGWVPFNHPSLTIVFMIMEGGGTGWSHKSPFHNPSEAMY